eukprot:SAG11_NODE_321_length_10781_cov_6.440835_4_plen_57_part_00
MNHIVHDGGRSGIVIRDVSIYIEPKTGSLSRVRLVSDFDPDSESDLDSDRGSDFWF